MQIRGRSQTSTASSQKAVHPCRKLFTYIYTYYVETFSQAEQTETAAALQVKRSNLGNGLVGRYASNTGKLEAILTFILNSNTCRRNKKKTQTIALMNANKRYIMNKNLLIKVSSQLTKITRKF